MILIKKGQTNNISLSVSLNRTIQNPYYLFSFTHIQSKNQINFIPKVILINDRYDEFQFVEAPTTNLSLDPPQAYFQYDGQYWVEVYEQTSSGNTNPSQSGQMLWDGRAVVEDPAVPSPYYQWTSNNEDNANFIFISDDELPVSPTPTPSTTPNIPTPTPSVTNTSTPTPTQTGTGTPTPTPTPTQTGTGTPTPTPTPTTSPTPKYSFSVTYDGNLNMLCSGGGTITLTLYGADPVYQNNTNLYLDNNLTISAPVGYAEYLGVILEINPAGVVSGVVVCPSSTPTPTPTQTPTFTPTPTQSPSPTPSGTPTQTPTPSSTPFKLQIGEGFDRPTTDQIFLDSSGNIFVGGSFDFYNGTYANSIVKMNQVGIQDIGFGAEIRSGANDVLLVRIYGFTEDPNTGELLVSGQFETVNGTQCYHFAPLNRTTGALNPNWTGTKIQNNNASGVIVEASGDYLIYGGFINAGGQSRQRIARFSNTGVLDLSVYGGTQFNNTPYKGIKTIDGKYVFVGNFTSYQGTARNRVVKIDPVTTLIDPTFLYTTGGNGIISDVIEDPTNGDLYFMGSVTLYNGNSVTRLWKTDINGNFVSTSSGGTILTSPWGGQLDLTNDLLYFYGSFGEIGGNGQYEAIARVQASTMSLDSTFQLGTAVGANWNSIGGYQGPGRLLLTPSKKIIYLGDFTSYINVNYNRIIQFNSSGIVETTN